MMEVVPLCTSSGILSLGLQEGRTAVKYMSVTLAGLFVVIIAARASADDVAMPRNRANYDGINTEQASKYFPAQKATELHAKLASNYDGCASSLRELGWNDVEIFYYCSWRHGHMDTHGGRPGKAAAVTGFVQDWRTERAIGRVSYRP